MKKKCGLILLLALTYAILGIHGQAEVLACHYLPCVEADTEASIDVSEGVYEFSYQLYHPYDKVAIQIDAGIECIPDGNGSCSNIQVYLAGSSITYMKKYKRFLKNQLCGELNYKPGPRPSYFLVVPLSNIDDEGVNSSDSEVPYHVPLTVNIVSTKKLSWGPGNVVINKNTCKVCDTSVPVVKTEISTAEQFIQLGACKVKVKFDSNNSPLPFKQNAVKCPSNYDGPFPRVSKVIPNEKVLLTVDTPAGGGNGDYIEQNTNNNQDLPFEEPLTFVQEPVKGQVPVAFKTNDNSTYWTYIPGYGWILVIY